MPRRIVPLRFCSAMKLTVAVAVAIAAPLSAASGDLLWEQRSSEAGSCSDPVALGSRVFTFTRGATNNQTLYPIVRAFALETGEPVWEARGRLGFFEMGSGLAASRGRIFSIAAKWTGPDEALVTARHAADGALIWQRHLDASSGYQFRAYSAQATEDAVFIVGSRADNLAADVPAQTEAMVLALDSRSGETLWEDHFSVLGGRDEAAGVVVGDGTVMVVGQDLPPNPNPRGYASNGLVRAYDAISGRLLWQDTDEGFVRRITIDRNRVLTLSSPTKTTAVTAYDLNSGERLWRSSTKRLVGEHLAASRRWVAVYGARIRTGKTRLQIYDRGTGELLRKRRDSSEGRQILASRGDLFTVGTPALAEQGIAVNSYRLRSGRSRWSYRQVDPEEMEFSCGGVLHKGVLVTTSTEFPGEIVRAFEK